MSDNNSSGKEEKEKSEQSTPSKLLERLNNDEFREYMPYMDLNELIFTEIYKDKWKQLFEIITKTKTILCYACNQKFPPDDIRTHINSTTHKENLEKVAQFYHPGYTYFRGARSLMRGKQVTGRDLTQAIELANGGLTKLAHDLATKDNELFVKPDLEKAIKNPEFEKTLQDLVLSTTPKSPEVVYAVAHLPLPMMLSVEFSVEENTWKPMLSCDDEEPLVTSTFTCELCNATLRRTGSLNAHLSGAQHLNKQFTTLGVRCPEHDFLTKNCVYRNNANYSFYINKAGQIFYKKKVDDILRQKNGGVIDPEVESALAALNIKVREKAEALKGQIKEHEAKEEENSEANKDSCKDGIDNSGLVGVEYVVRIIPIPFSNKMDYECTLCNHVTKETRMAEHLVSQTHRQKYMEQHYPDTMARYNEVIGHMKYFNFIRVCGLVLSKLAKALEKYHGYGAVRDVPQSLWNRNRAIILAEIRNQPHASQAHGPSFTNVVSRDEVRHFITSPELSISNNVVYSKPERFTKSSPKDYKLCAGPLDDPVRGGARNGSRRSRSPPNRKRSHSRSPRRHSRSSPPSSRDIWKRYRHEVSKSAIEIENKYNAYRKNPETHPQYNKEWNTFWKQRKLDLIAQGIEHQGYNYQPEWVNFFKQRIEVFFGEALQNAQLDIRRRLHIPFDAEEDTPPEAMMRGGEKYRRLEDNVGVAGGWNGPSRDFENARDSHRPPAAPLPPLLDNKPNVIHVLRLLSALEDHLGSLGQKVMDLLSKALALEKHFGDNYMALESKVLNSESCTLIETAVEKLKGVIFAGLCDSNKELSFQRVVQAAENLLKHADIRGYRNVRPSESKNASSRNDGGNMGRGNANGSDLQQLLSAIQSQQGGFNNAQGSNNSLSNQLMASIGGGSGGGGKSNQGQRMPNRGGFGGPKRGGGGGGGGNMSGGNQVRRDIRPNSNENWRGFSSNQQKPNPQQYRWTGPNAQQQQHPQPPQQNSQQWGQFNQRNGGMGGRGGGGAGTKRF